MHCAQNRAMHEYTCETCGHVTRHEEKKRAWGMMVGHINGCRKKAAFRPGKEKEKPKPARTPIVRRVWTDWEFTAIIEHAAMARIQDPVAPFVDLLYAAQDAVKPKSPYQIFKKPILDKSAAAFTLRVKAIEQAALDSVKEQHTPTSIEGLVIEVPIQPDPIKFIKDQPTQSLAVELFTRFMARMDRLEAAILKSSKNGNGHGILQSFDRPIESPRIAHTIPTAPAVPKVPRIAIVGLLADQFEHVKQKVAAKDVELIHIDSRRNPGPLPPVSAVITTRWVDHRWTDQVRAAGIARENVFHCDGGQTQVVQKIFDWCSRQRPQYA